MTCSTAQREKTLDKQLHSLLEQLAVKQVLSILHGLYSTYMILFVFKKQFILSFYEEKIYIFGNGWIITVWMIICLLFVFSTHIWLPRRDESNNPSFFRAFRHKLKAFLVKFIWKRWSWKDWMRNGDKCKAIIQRWTMLGTVLLKARLISYMVCQIMKVIKGFLTILQEELKASRGLCYLGRHLCFIF